LPKKSISLNTEGLTDIETKEINNGIKISGKVKQGMGEGLHITTAFLKYQQSAITITTDTPDPVQLEKFDRILSTFKFLD